MMYSERLTYGLFYTIRLDQADAVNLIFQGE